MKIQHAAGKLLLLCLLGTIISCGYDEIADAPYPQSQIYFPIAVSGSISPNGIYTIEEGASTSWVSPTPGQPVKYSVKKAENQFIVPLGIYRSGTGGTIGGAVNTTLAFDTDTILALIASGKLEGAELLPVGNAQIPTSLQVAGGKNDAAFDLILDLEFLRKDAPKKYAIAIRLSDSPGNVNPDLSVGIILIDTQITMPTADFTAQISGSTTDTYSFKNTSLYWDFFSGENAFSWDFGDGSEISNEINPEHQYAAAGEYTVTLTTKGITGETVSVSKKVTVN